MNILMLLSKEFTNDPRVYKEAKTLIDAGNKVTVLMWDRYKLKEHTEIETIDGIQIIRIYNTFFMKLLPSNLLRNPFWWRIAYQKSIQLYTHFLNSKKFCFDVVHCHDLDTLKIGVKLKKTLDIQLIYDAHEIFGYMIARNMPNIIVKYVFKMEKQLLRYVDYIITVNKNVQSYLESITNKPISIIMNCKDLINKKYVPSKNNVFTLCYIGVLHKNRMFPEIIDTIGHIQDVKFIIAGKKENLYETVREKCRQYNNIEFLGSIPYNEVIPRTQRSDAIICMINPDDKNNKYGLANKQFEAMVCGRPIITTKQTYAGDITQDLECGLTTYYNTSYLKTTIETLRDNKELCIKLGKNALKAAKEYNWGNQEKKLLDIYEALE